MRHDFDCLLTDLGKDVELERRGVAMEVDARR